MTSSCSQQPNKTLDHHPSSSSSLSPCFLYKASVAYETLRIRGNRIVTFHVTHTTFAAFSRVLIVPAAYRTVTIYDPKAFFTSRLCLTFFSSFSSCNRQKTIIISSTLASLHLLAGLLVSFLLSSSHSFCPARSCCPLRCCCVFERSLPITTGY